MPDTSLDFPPFMEGLAFPQVHYFIHILSSFSLLKPGLYLWITSNNNNILNYQPCFYCYSNSITN